MLIGSAVLNVVLAVLVLALWSDRKQIPKRDKSGRFQAKTKKVKVAPIPDFFKDLTGEDK